MKKSIYILIVFTTLLSNQVISQEGWFWQNPRPQGNDIYDICRDVSSGTYFACGDYGTLLSKKVDYSKWLAFQAPTQENLYSICFQNTHGWAVGYNGTIIHCEGDNLIKWHEQESGTDKMLLSVFFIDTKNGWAVGQDETILRTNNGGKDWTNLSGIGSQHYFSVYFLDENNGWLAGAAGHNGVIKYTQNGGDTWTNSIIPANRMNSIYFYDLNYGCAVGDNGAIFVTTDGGANWTLPNSNTTSHLKDVWLNHAGKCKVVGYNGTILYSDDFGVNWSVQISGTDNILYGVDTWRIVGQAGDILHQHESGGEWQFESSGFTDWLSSIDFVDENNGWVVGAKGTIYQTVDGGVQWTKNDSVVNWIKNDSLAAYDLRAVDFIYPNAGFAVGEYGTILKYRNSYGLTFWIDKSISTTNHLNAVHKRFRGKAWVAGEFGSIWKTEDYGDTWQIQHQNSGYHLYAINFVSKNYGWAAGMSGTVLKTTDGGDNWVDISPDNLSKFHSIYFTDYQHGWVVGVGGIIYRTTDGGDTWIETTPKVTYERLNSVYFVDENRGWIAGANGTILYSYDGGENWYFQNSGGISELRSLSFTENGVGWIAGFDGVILKTVDGGGELTVSTYRRFALNFEIPDLGVASDILDVEASPKLLKVLEDNVVSGITVMLDSVIHSHVADLTLLLSHEGITDTLIYQAGEEGANIINCNLSDASTTVIDEGEAPFSGTYKSHSPLSVFNGVNPIGEWTLSIYDDIEGNTGTLQAWGLKLYFDKATAIACPEPVIPKEFKLYQNYPNPFNPSTKIKYQIPVNSKQYSVSSNQYQESRIQHQVFVSLKVYDILGREVATLVNEQQQPGYYEVNFDGSGLTSGVYIYRLHGGSFIESKKLLFIK
ncbi:MAG: YCF48-related protein [Bacteroidota bacterium]